MNPLVVDATDMRARSIEIINGMEYDNGKGKTEKINSIPIKEKVFHVKNEVLCFTWEGRFFAVPYHNENYVEILEDLGYVDDELLEVPFTSKNSYPLTEKLKWKLYMSLSRRNFYISKR